jgi:hypothetical protein
MFERRPAAEIGLDDLLRRQKKPADDHKHAATRDVVVILCCLQHFRDSASPPVLTRARPPNGSLRSPGTLAVRSETNG